MLTDKSRLVSGVPRLMSGVRHCILLSVAAEAAASLYRLAAEAGSIEGMYSLGWVHAAGKGLPRNRTQAAALYKLAIQKAPDWRHAAPPFIALLLLPGLVALQWVQILSPALTSFEIAGNQCVPNRCVLLIMQSSSTLIAKALCVALGKLPAWS